MAILPLLDRPLDWAEGDELDVARDGSADDVDDAVVLVVLDAGVVGVDDVDVSVMVVGGWDTPLDGGVVTMICVGAVDVEGGDGAAAVIVGGADAVVGALEEAGGGLDVGGALLLVISVVPGGVVDAMSARSV